MKDENYINIQGWMINKLRLSGNELIAYAIVHGFSQDGVTEYKGSISYIAKGMNVTDRTAVRVMKSLVEKNLVRKSYSTALEDKGTALYMAVIPKKSTYDKMSHVCKNVQTPMTICPNTHDKMSYNNNIYNNTNNNKTQALTIKMGEFENVVLSEEEKTKLLESDPITYPNLIEELSQYLASSGKKYKSHYATLLAWNRRRNTPNQYDNKLSVIKAG